MGNKLCNFNYITDGDWAQSPIPNTQNPKPHIKLKKLKKTKKIKIGLKSKKFYI